MLEKQFSLKKTGEGTLKSNKRLYQIMKGDRAYFLATNMELNPIDIIIDLERKQVFE